MLLQAVLSIVSLLRLLQLQQRMTWLSCQPPFCLVLSLTLGQVSCSCWQDYFHHLQDDQAILNLYLMSLFNPVCRDKVFIAVSEIYAQIFISSSILCTPLPLHYSGVILDFSSLRKCSRSTNMPPPFLPRQNAHAHCDKITFRIIGVLVV